MTSTELTQTGRILHLQRLSTEDGPGIRTTVFFKGCPLHCSWCHNPESNTPYVQIQWLENHCILCDACLEACTEGTLTRSEQGIAIDREECIACGECVIVCPSGALEQLGQEMELEALVTELVKDRAYFDAAGGVTLSGGEPLMQPAFAASLLQRLKTAGLQTALDTCGLANRAALESALPWTDMVLYDVKLFDPDAHRQYTGQDNKVILDNLRWLGDYIRKNGTPRLWIRTPLIPGATDLAENVRAIGGFLAAELGDLVERWELCAFNNLCRDKYRRLDLQWPFEDAPLLTRAEMDALQEIARGCGLPADRVAVTGAARLGIESN